MVDSDKFPFGAKGCKRPIFRWELVNVNFRECSGLPLDRRDAYFQIYKPCQEACHFKQPKIWDVIGHRIKLFGFSIVRNPGCVKWISLFQQQKWVFPKIGVPPKSSILIGFSIRNHPFWGTRIFGNTQIIKKSFIFEGHLPRFGTIWMMRFRHLCAVRGSSKVFGRVKDWLKAQKDLK